MRRGKSGKASEKQGRAAGHHADAVRPSHDRSRLFITLDEMSGELPDLFEYVGGKCPPRQPG